MLSYVPWRTTVHTSLENGCLFLPYYRTYSTDSSPRSWVSYVQLPPFVLCCVCSAYTSRKQVFSPALPCLRSTPSVLSRPKRMKQAHNNNNRHYITLGSHIKLIKLCHFTLSTISRVKYTGFKMHFLQVIMQVIGAKVLALGSLRSIYDSNELLC